VRVRPLNAREIARGASVIVKMEGKQTIVSPPEGSGTTRTPDRPRVFSYDHSYWSFDKKDAHFGMSSIGYRMLIAQQVSNESMMTLARIYWITRSKGIILAFLRMDRQARENRIR
jgi:hypothetical protein